MKVLVVIGGQLSVFKEDPVCRFFILERWRCEHGGHMSCIRDRRLQLVGHFVVLKIEGCNLSDILVF